MAECIEPIRARAAVPWRMAYAPSIWILLLVIGVAWLSERE
jgi:hypothetical protein